MIFCFNFEACQEEVDMRKVGHNAKETPGRNSVAQLGDIRIIEVIVFQWGILFKASYSIFSFFGAQRCLSLLRNIYIYSIYIVQELNPATTWTIGVVLNLWIFYCRERPTHHRFSCQCRSFSLRDVFHRSSDPLITIRWWVWSNHSQKGQKERLWKDPFWKTNWNNQLEHWNNPHWTTKDDWTTLLKKGTTLKYQSVPFSQEPATFGCLSAALGCAASTQRDTAGDAGNGALSQVTSTDKMKYKKYKMGIDGST